MFGRFKGYKSTIYNIEEIPEVEFKAAVKALPINTLSGVTVDPSCNQTITISCLKQLYNAVGYEASANPANSIGITGYLVSQVRCWCSNKTLTL